MSGIAGVIGLDGAPQSQELLERIIAATPHRPADGVGHWHAGPALMIRFHRPVTPESLTERQPLQRGQMTICFDGRLDNRDELMRLLTGQQALPPGAPDCEIVLALGQGLEDRVVETLVLPCHGTVALVGPSGAGKSTLGDIVGGLLAPTSGRLLIDGRKLQDRRAWRDQVAYVSQDGFLLNASVRENLLWTHPAATEAELWAVLWAVLEQAAADFVKDLPRGLDAELGERGVRLSGGERQRLTIARALLRRPRLLILDEANSALDRHNERRIQEAIAKLHGQLSILVIAHRLDTVREADCIHVMDGGVIRESGSFEQLQACGSGYLTAALGIAHA